MSLIYKDIFFEFSSICQCFFSLYVAVSYTFYELTEGLENYGYGHS